MPTPLWRRVFQGRHPTIDNTPSIRLPHLLTAPLSANTPPHVPLEPEVTCSHSSSLTTPSFPRPNEDKISPKEKPKPPKWSAVYNPKVKLALNLRLARTFTYDTKVYSMHMSPDGKRIAAGLSDNGKIYINDIETGSNIRLVSEILVLAFRLTRSISVSSWTDM